MKLSEVINAATPGPWSAYDWQNGGINRDDSRFIKVFDPTHVSLMEAMIPDRPLEFDTDSGQMWCPYCLAEFDDDYNANHTDDCAAARLVAYRKAHGYEG